MARKNRPAYIILVALVTLLLAFYFVISGAVRRDQNIAQTQVKLEVTEIYQTLIASQTP